MSRINWLLILCFPHGGSTAFAKTLLTAEGAISLTPRAEGHGLVPEMRAAKRRWDPSYVLDYDHIREVWRNRASKSCGPNGQVTVIEKSPPNMVRYKAMLRSLSPDNTNLVTFSRDPYAVIARWAKKTPERIAEQWGWPASEPENQDEFFGALAEIWVSRASLLVGALADSVCHVRYEDFCDRPQDILDALSDQLPVLSTAHPSCHLKVKDYPTGPIVNMNERQIADLGPDAIQAISRKLSAARDVLKQLGYDLRDV